MHLSIICICLACLIPSTWSLPWGLPWQKPHHKHHEPKEWQKRNLATITSIYNLTVFPNQEPILERGAAGVPAGLFNENATGRVDPVGNFTGFNDSIEYFFALAPVPTTNAAGAGISSIQITEFSSACPNIAASVVYLFTNQESANGTDVATPTAPLKEVSFRNSISST